MTARERDREVPRVARTCLLNRKSLPFREALEFLPCPVLLGLSASQRLVRLLKDETVDRDDDDDRLEHEVVDASASRTVGQRSDRYQAVTNR